MYSVFPLMGAATYPDLCHHPSRLTPSCKERFHLPFYLGAPDSCEVLNTDETPSVASFSCLLSVINHVIHNNHDKPETYILYFKISWHHPFLQAKKISVLQKMTEPCSISRFLVKQTYDKDGRCDSQTLEESCQLLSKKERGIFFQVS